MARIMLLGMVLAAVLWSAGLRAKRQSPARRESRRTCSGGGWHGIPFRLLSARSGAVPQLTPPPQFEK